MKIKPIAIASFYVVLLSSCSSSTESELTTPTTTTPTTTTTTISYAKDIAPIITSNCISCHGTPTQNGASQSLDTALKVKNAILNSSLITLISKTQGTSGLMPRNGTRLPQATIDKVIAWQTDGFKD